MSGTRSSARRGPAISAVTLVLAAHGIDGGPGVAVEHAEALRRRGGFADVRVGCLKALPDLAEALRDATAPVCIVPLLMAEGFIFDLLRRRVAELAAGADWRLAAPVGLHPGLTRLVRRKAEATLAAEGISPGNSSLLLVGHGTPRHGGSAEATRAQARRLANSGFAAVEVAFLEEPPLVSDVAPELPGDVVAAVGLFLDNGPHGDVDVRDALAASGRRVLYAGAVGADPGLLPLIIGQAEAAMRRRAA
jgi:sirohydrochlorin ferrochelatase